MKDFSNITTQIELADVYQSGMTFDELEEAVETHINEQEIIYYSRAIDLLKEFDPSLRESLSLADELGLTPENLNSEVLATLLHQQRLREDWADIRNEVEELFESDEEE